MPRSRTRVDVARLAEAVRRPGIDPRVWLTLAVVTELGFDSQEGIFADVKFVPSGQEETCLIASSYAGNLFGAWFPLSVDDTVLVAVPSGDQNAGPVIIARLWSAADKPHSDFGSGVEPSQNLTMRAQEGRKFAVKTSGTGEVDIQAEGAADARLRAGNVVRLQAGTQSFIRGDDYASALNTYLSAETTLEVAINTFLIAQNTYVLAIQPIADPTGVATAVFQTAIAALTAAISVFTTAIATFQAQQAQYLSQKVKGE